MTLRGRQPSYLPARCIGKGLLGAAAFVGAGLVHGSEARAQDVPVADYGPVLLGIYDVVQAPPLIGNIVYVARQRRAPLYWPILGFAFGAGGVALGLAFALPNASSQDTNASTKVALGTATAIEGAANIGFGIWALVLPRREVVADDRHLHPRWDLAPRIAKDETGRFQYGAVIRVGQF
jgi:hypothetical protein